MEWLRSLCGRACVYECDRCSLVPVGCARLTSDESLPGNSSPKKPCSFRKPPLMPLAFEPWLLAVVVMLATEGRLSSVKYAASGESVLPAGVARLSEVRKPGDSWEPSDKLSVESSKKVIGAGTGAGGSEGGAEAVPPREPVDGLVCC